MSESTQLLITGSLAVMVIVGLILFVNNNPLTGAVSYTRSESYATKQYPCSTLKGYCFNEDTSQVCSFKADGWCPRSCTCRLY
ncbi:hypothetical protein HY641_03550 [Candidatus Woesearchaeota archaeon]|nr:hypothetical protein [Candidatus Woesearchaeota archaeon]